MLAWHRAPPRARHACPGAPLLRISCISSRCCSDMFLLPDASADAGRAAAAGAAVSLGICTPAQA